MKLGNGNPVLEAMYGRLEKLGVGSVHDRPDHWGLFPRFEIQMNGDGKFQPLLVLPEGFEVSTEEEAEIAALEICPGTPTRIRFAPLDELKRRKENMDSFFEQDY